MKNFCVGFCIYLFIKLVSMVGKEAFSPKGYQWTQEMYLYIYH